MTTSSTSSPATAAALPALKSKQKTAKRSGALSQIELRRLHELCRHEFAFQPNAKALAIVWPPVIPNSDCIADQDKRLQQYRESKFAGPVPALQLTDGSYVNRRRFLLALSSLSIHEGKYRVLLVPVVSYTQNQRKIRLASAAAVTAGGAVQAAATSGAAADATDSKEFKAETLPIFFEPANKKDPYADCWLDLEQAYEIDPFQLVATGCTIGAPHHRCRVAIKANDDYQGCRNLAPLIRDVLTVCDSCASQTINELTSCEPANKTSQWKALAPTDALVKKLVAKGLRAKFRFRYNVRASSGMLIRSTKGYMAVVTALLNARPDLSHWGEQLMRDAMTVHAALIEMGEEETCPLPAAALPGPEDDEEDAGDEHADSDANPEAPAAEDANPPSDQPQSHSLPPLHNNPSLDQQSWQHILSVKDDAQLLAHPDVERLRALRLSDEEWRHIVHVASDRELLAHPDVGRFRDLRLSSAHWQEIVSQPTACELLAHPHVARLRDLRFNRSEWDYVRVCSMLDCASRACCSCCNRRFDARVMTAATTAPTELQSTSRLTIDRNSLVSD